MPIPMVFIRTEKATQVMTLNTCSPMTEYPTDIPERYQPHPVLHGFPNTPVSSRKTGTRGPEAAVTKETSIYRIASAILL